MKKLKKPLLEKNKFDLFKPDVRTSRLTISSRICNQDKFQWKLELSRDENKSQNR